MADCDAALVQRCLTGDQSGMRALVERFGGMVFGLCFRMLGHREDAEDVVQEVFVRIFRSLHRWDSARPLKPWLMMIAANRCRTAMESRSRRPAPADFVDATADDAPADDGDLAEELQRALENIREEYRTCFILFHQQESSIAEIGEIMGCPQGTVKTWLHRARRELAEHLQRRGYGPEASHELHGI